MITDNIYILSIDVCVLKTAGKKEGSWEGGKNNATLKKDQPLLKFVFRIVNLDKQFNSQLEIKNINYTSNVCVEVKVLYIIF